MAETYFGYEKGERLEPINWSKIGANYSQTIVDIMEDRARRKKEIDDKLATDLEYLENNPQGQHKGTSDGVAQLAQDLRAQTLELERQLKNGQLNLRDYTLQRQNMMSDTKRVFEAAKELQANFATINERTQANINQTLEDEAWEEYGGLINFETHGIYIDPNTGRIMMGEKDEKGVIKPETLNSIETILNGMNQRYDRFDELDWVESQTKYIDDFKSYTPQMLIDNPRIKAEWNTVKEAAISEAMTNDYNISSVLTESLGTNENGIEYRSTTNREEFEADKIENGGTGTLFFKQFNANNSGVLELEFQDSQLDAVRNHLGSKMEMAVGFEKKPRTDKGKGKGKGKGKLTGDEIIEKLDIFVSDETGENAELAEKILKENYNTFKSDLPEEQQKTIETFDRIDEDGDGNVDTYIVTFVDYYGDRTQKKINVGDATSNEARIEALWEFLNPDKEQEWDDSYTIFSENNQITDITGRTINPYLGSRDLVYEASDFDNIIIEGDKSLGEYIKDTPTITSNSEHAPAIEDVLIKAFEGSGMRRSDIDVEVKPSDKGNNYFNVYIDGNLVKEDLEWKSTGTGLLNNKDLSLIKDDLQGIYDDYMKQYTPKRTSPTRTQNVPPGDNIFLNNQSNRQNNMEEEEEEEVGPSTVEEQFRENVQSIRVGKPSEEKQQIVLDLFERYPNIFEDKRITFNEFQTTLGEEYERKKWDAYTSLHKKMQEAIAQQLNQEEE